jgi:hypothetical protein
LIESLLFDRYTFLSLSLPLSLSPSLSAHCFAMPLPKRAKTGAGGSASGEAGSADNQSDERETWDEAASVALVRQYMEKGMHTLVPKAHGMGERGTKGARWTAISADFELWYV